MTIKLLFSNIHVFRPTCPKLVVSFAVGSTYHWHSPENLHLADGHYDTSKVPRVWRKFKTPSLWGSKGCANNVNCRWFNHIFLVEDIYTDSCKFIYFLCVPFWCCQNVKDHTWQDGCIPSNHRKQHDFQLTGPTEFWNEEKKRQYNKVCFLFYL